jgi:hypothetical protein
MSGTSKKPRIERKHDAEKVFTDATYRSGAFDWLMEDFGDRCAYSLIHRSTVGDHNIEVDHFNPSAKGAKRHRYGNLYPAYSACNNAKRKAWPKKRDLEKRRRYLDCCKEEDYGVHLFEDAATGELLATTPEGVYHAENCSLFSEWLKLKRRERTEDAQVISGLKKIAATLSGPELKAMNDNIDLLQRRLNTAIPPIKALPTGSKAL